MAKPDTQRPLGLKEGFEVSQSVLETLAYIEAFDLEADREYTSILKRLTHGGATREFKRFLRCHCSIPEIRHFRSSQACHSIRCGTPSFSTHPATVSSAIASTAATWITCRARAHQTEQRVFAGPMQFTVEKMNAAFDPVNKRFWRKIAYVGRAC